MKEFMVERSPINVNNVEKSSLRCLALKGLIRIILEKIISVNTVGKLFLDYFCSHEQNHIGKKPYECKQCGKPLLQLVNFTPKKILILERMLPGCYEVHRKEFWTPQNAENGGLLHALLKPNHMVAVENHQHHPIQSHSSGDPSTDQGL
ncbi:putative zinc finger protein 818 isoform X3 [Marmota monax]|uniref:Uncharacterized protein n=1 Tax=Marmota monax TaxID=9995 RepID=A0A5E4CJ12_MARMO|nr:putative zinc finger protein 818 isoform X3 [Marmota monax]VTJ81857.1 Hypothetical predicted protein [Marmota monax]